MIAFVLFLGILLGAVLPKHGSLGPVGHGSLTPRPPITVVPEGPTMPEEAPSSGVSVVNAPATEITGGYEKGTSQAWQTSEYLGAVTQIVKPVEGTLDERERYGVKEYPKYGSSLKGYTVEERDGIIRESHALAPSPTWKSLGIYNGIDSAGYLIKNGARVSDGMGGYKVLYAHTASVSNYGGGLSDSEPRLIKRITCKTHTKLASTQITGLYAPAGEVIKVELSKDEYYAAGGLRIYIGQNYNLDQHVSMETAGNGIKGTGLNRMSDILSIFELKDANKNVIIEGDKVTAYVGSFLGGPIYVRPISNKAVRDLTVTISGAVKYQHFILGVTTPEEYDFNKTSTAPYFDLEIYDSVRFTTPKYASSGGLALKDYTYENCTDAAILWDKIAEVSTRVAANGLSASSAQVYLIGDCYIAAGAAFANPGRNGVVCPPGWLAEALNYKNFVNGGCWGTMHEYNHCWQGYGFGNGGEVTNNATTLVSYSLYTRISQGRTTAPGWGNGSWNRFTDPAKSLGDLLNQSRSGGKNFDLPLYATLIHNIGQANFVTAARGGREAQSGVYYNNLVNAAHYDMTYYATEILNYNVAEEGAKGTLPQATVNAVKAKGYPTFVPVASVYQVGRSIMRDGVKEYITTAQPFSYGSGTFTMDFSNKNNFTAGQFNSKALVIPDGFTVTVKSVTQPQSGTVELLADNKVKYTPTSGQGGLYSGNFNITLGITKNDGAFTVEDVDLVINLKQSTNTALNRTTYTYATEAQAPSTDSVYNAQTMTFNFGDFATTETKKNVCTQETNTQIWQAGWNYDDDTYDKNSKNYRVMPNNKTLQTLDGVMYFGGAGTYRFTLKGRGKGTLYLSYDNGATYESAFTFNRTSGNAYVNTEYAEHEFTAARNYVYFKVVLLVTKESDFFGIGVAAKQADDTFSSFTNAKDAFTNPSVHRQVIEESARKFVTEYRFKNEYQYDYSSTDTCWATSNSPVSVSHNPWDANQPITNMFDGDAKTSYHSEAGEANYITAAKPFELVVDLGSFRKVNSVTFYGYRNNHGNKGMPATFTLYGSAEPDKNFTVLISKTDMDAPNQNVTLDFDTATIRYYKLVVTKTDNSRYFAMNKIVFSYKIAFAGGYHIAPNAENVKYTGTWTYKSVLCNFGSIYTANAGAKVEFTFTGTRFAYFAYQSTEYGTVDIYVDGNKVASDVSLSADKNAGSVIYIHDGDALSNGQHVVRIEGKSGKFNVDSFAYWK